MSRLGGTLGCALAVAACAARTASAADDGVARTPPMGWRSWNYYACEINASVFERQIDALADRSRKVDGVPTSLVDLGYATVGIDDCWQDCTSPDSLNGSYHTADGKPIVDTTRFPEGLRALSDYGKSKGVGLGWYGNNCPETHGVGRGPKYCSEHGKLTHNWDKAREGDVAALIEYNISAVKLDNPGCGANDDMQAYYDLVNQTAAGRVVIENCHFNVSFPRWADRPGGTLECPMHLYRVSNDIKANWASILSNAHATIPFASQDNPMSRPGCWAYPDMLEVGVTGQNGHSEGGLSPAEQRSHFGLWCVVSSPLTLSLDLGDSALLDKVWDVITNKEALAVNQQWAGHPGTLVDQDKDNAGGEWQAWAKPQPGGATAVFLINTGAGSTTLSLTPSDFVTAPRGTVAVRDIWNRKDLGQADAKQPMPFNNVASHDSVFVLLTPH